jgi:hypothetical protein
VLLIAPSAEFVAGLPGGKIPDRKDFYAFDNDERMRRWQAALDASQRLGEEMRELLETGQIVDRITAW